MQPLLPLEAVSRMSFVLLTTDLGKYGHLFCAPEALISSRWREALVRVRSINVLRHTRNHVTTLASFAPSHLWICVSVRIIKRMRKQWKPGPFLLPFSGLGTRLLLCVHHSVFMVPAIPAIIVINADVLSLFVHNCHVIFQFRKLQCSSFSCQWECWTSCVYGEWEVECAGWWQLKCQQCQHTGREIALALLTGTSCYCLKLEY